ncbi:MAG: hypothetical protein EOO01_26735 [Chitinophagaceae bacterium]|nr:MAG: hypothetical protein EOO01_26735 [Chitinophagaceae bacterium]
MKYLVVLLFVFLAASSPAQRIEKFYVNLYTDSLKKGTYNYINIEGVTGEGNFLPLDTSHIIFTASAGKFYGNSLWIEPTCQTDSITITATLKEKASEKKTFVIFIKKNEDNENLPSEADIINRSRKNRRD